MIVQDSYMDDWEICNETSLSEKEDFYSHINMEDITDAVQKHAKSSVPGLGQQATLKKTEVK